MADEMDRNISVSAPVFYLLIGAAGLGGLGGGSFLAPALERQAIQACFDNSQIAIDVAAQHGAEIQTLRQLIWDRTQDRWTEDDHRDYERGQDRLNAEVLRRLERLEQSQ